MAVSNTTQVAYGEPADSSLATFLRESGWVINLEEMRAYPHRYKALDVPEWVSATHGAWLIVPLFTSSGMIGFRRSSGMTDADQRAYQQKLHQQPYLIEMARSFNLGGHFGCVNRVFVERWIAPLLKNPRRGAGC